MTEKAQTSEDEVIAFGHNCMYVLIFRYMSKMTYNNRREKCPKCNKLIGKQYINRHIKQVHDKILERECDVCKSCFATYKITNLQFTTKK